MAENRPKLKWNQHPIDDDITFLGPLSYRHFKIIGWLLFIVKMILPVLNLATKADPGLAEALAIPLGLMGLLAPLSVFFLLIASLSQLFVTQNYKKQLISNGVSALAIIFIFELLYHRYVVGAVDAFVGDRDQTLAICNEMFSSSSTMGFVAFNVFLDLFLCTSVMFFLNYVPSKVFVGDKLKWFRCFALLPVVYELVCLWLKLEANAGDFHLPISLFPFLPTKPPMMFFVVCAMIVYHAFNERLFCKAGRTHEEYVAYLDTNRNAWEFAKFAAIACLIGGILDAIIAWGSVWSDVQVAGEYLKTLSRSETQVWFVRLIFKYFNAGFGGSMDLVIFAPIMLLFNYKKTYENTAIELAIPLGSIVLLIFIYLEIGLLAIQMLGAVAKEQVIPQIAQLLAASGLEMDDGGSSGGGNENAAYADAESVLEELAASEGMTVDELLMESGIDLPDA